MELMSKKLIKNSILKFSNLTLFERREKQYKYDQNFKTKTPKIFKVSKLYHKKVENTKENTLYQFYQTMSSFHSSEKNSTTILPLLEYFENSKKRFKEKKYHKLSIINKKSTKYQLNKNDKKSKTMNNFYMTEASPTKDENSNTLNNVSSLFKNKNKKNKIVDLNIDTLLSIQTYRINEKNKNKNKNKNNNLTISSYFPNKTKSKAYSYIKHETSNKILGKTIDERQFKSIMEGNNKKTGSYENKKIKDFIKKIQEFKVQNYANKIKKEREIRLEEAYYNQIEYYQDTMNSLQSAKKLLDIQFSNKIADYTRYVISKKEREIVTSSKKIQEIINHKKEIEHIKSKIAKIEIEKNNILKWIYFMIQMKEKLLVLPNYYKIIIEKEAINKRLSMKQSTRREDKSNSKRGLTKRKSFRKSSYFHADNLLFNNKEKENKDSKDNKDISEIDISKKEEYDRILNYKNELIYQTPEEFQERLLSLQKENLLLLHYNNDLNNQVFYLKKELKSLFKYKNKIELKNNIIISKTKELEDIKSITEGKMRLIADFKRSEEILEIEYKKEREKGIQNH